MNPTDPKTPPPIPLTKMLSTGLSAGMVAGALMVLLDGITSHTQPTASTVVLLTACWAAAIGGLGIVIALPLGFLRNLLIRQLPPAAWTALLWGMAVQLPLSVSLSGNRLLVTAPLPWILAWLIYSRSHRHPPRPQFVRAIALALFCGLSSAATRQVAIDDLGIVVFAVAFVGFCLLALAIQHATARYLIIPLFLLLVPSVLLAAFATTPAGWVDNEIPRAAPSSQPAANKPNIVLIVLDTTRLDHLGCYGSKQGLTPRLDAFAAESTVYLNTYTTGPWTLPSHASLFTGYHTPTHGCDNEPHRWLDDGFVTLPEMLAPHGYRSAALVANNYVEEGNLLQGFDDYLMLASGRKGSRLFSTMATVGAPASWTDHGAAEGLDALRRWLASGRDPKKPFMLFINLLEPHWPHFPPLAERLAHLPPGVSFREAVAVASRYYGVRWMAGQHHSPRDEKIIRALYAAQIAYQDRILGDMLAALRQSINLDNSLLIITSDHGENLGEAGRWDHMFSLNDTLTHVPLIVRYPDKLARGQRIAGLNQLVDVVPTVFDMLGAPCPVPDVQGHTLRPDRFQPYDAVFTQASPYYGHLERMESATGFERDVHAFTSHLRSVRDARFKLVHSSHGEWKLFDLPADPFEERDVKGEHPAEFARLRGQLEKWHAAQPLYKPRPGDRTKPKRSRRAGLTAIGYVNQN